MVKNWIKVIGGAIMATLFGGCNAHSQEVLDVYGPPPMDLEDPGINEEILDKNEETPKTDDQPVEDVKKEGNEANVALPADAVQAPKDGVVEALYGCPSAVDDKAEDEKKAAEEKNAKAKKVNRKIKKLKRSSDKCPGCGVYGPRGPMQNWGY